jgi:hypothetical protein
MEIKNLDGTVTISLVEFDKMRNDLKEKTEALEKNKIEVMMYDNPWPNIWTNWRLVTYFTNDEVLYQFSKQVECLNKLIVEKDKDIQELSQDCTSKFRKISNMSICEFRKWRKDQK